MNIWVDTNGWPIPPAVLLGCLIVEILYFRGWRVLLKEEQEKKAKEVTSTGPSQGATGSHAGRAQWDSVWLWRGIYFLAAILIAIIGDSAPVDILSGRLFWVHMVQHLFLLVVMAPLLVAAAPLQPLWLGLPAWARRAGAAFAQGKLARALYSMGGWLRHPAVSCALLVVGVSIWHWPALYDLALTNDAIHDWGEHLSFLVVSVLFWSQIIPSPPLRLRAGYVGRLACVGVAIAQNLILAILLGFAQTPLYAPYAHLAATAAGGFTAIQDQQLGAGIMWTFGDVPFGIAVSIIFQRWFTSQSGEDSIPARVASRLER